MRQERPHGSLVQRTEGDTLRRRPQAEMHGVRDAPLTDQPAVAELPQRRGEPVGGTAPRDSIALGRSPAPIADRTPTCPLLGAWAGAIPGAEERHWIMLSCRADDVPGTAYRHATIAPRHSARLRIIERCA